MRITAIGGGDVGAGETLAIDRDIVAQAGVPNPRALFVPTASQDSEDYVERFTRTYESLGCSVEVVRFWSSDDCDSARVKLARADVVYVGGGNTKAMLEKWAEEEFDSALREFVHSDKSVSGLSAGAICWFRVANSDWPQFYGIEGVNTAPLECMGLVDLALCPHTRDEGFRLAEFSSMMREIEGVGVGLDDGCALQIRDESYRVLAAQPNSFAHRVYRLGDGVKREVLEPHSDWRPLSLLQDASTPVGRLVD